MTRSGGSHLSALWIPATIGILLTMALLVAVRTPPVAVIDPSALTVTPQRSPIPLGTPTVRYAVAGSGAARVSYITDRGDLTTEQIHLPWSRDLRFPSPMRPASITATAAGGPGLSCQVLVDGAARASQSTADGTVSCTVVAI